MDAASQVRKDLDTAPLGAAGLKGREVKVAKGVERNGGLPGFAPNPEMTEALFEARAGHWLPVAYAVEGDNGSGAVLVRVKGVQPPDAAEWDMVKDIMVPMPCLKCSCSGLLPAPRSRFTTKILLTARICNSKRLSGDGICAHIACATRP